MTTQRAKAWLVAAELALKVNRFEVTAALVLVVGIAIAAVITAGRFASVDATPDCLSRWIASLPVDETCTAAVQAWSALTEGDAGKIMAAMSVVPIAVGLLFGVPIVAREIDAGTASLSWAIAGSRLRWFWRIVVPFLGLLVVALTVAAVSAGALADARTGGNIWSSTFADADLFGAPAVMRGLVAFAIGIVVGALVGRILPAILIAIVLIWAVVSAVGTLQSTVVRSTYQVVDIGASGAGVRFMQENPDFEVGFVTEDQRLVMPDQAAIEAPPGTADPVRWLAERARLIPFGVSRAATSRWQGFATVVLGATVIVLLLASAQIVRRRSPR